MIAEIKISEIMNSKLIVLHPKDTIMEARNIFNRYQVHHIPVAINRKLVGIVSLGDILAADKILQHRHQDKFPLNNAGRLSTIEEIMTEHPYYILETDSITKALQLMKEKRINCLPIVADGLLTGIVTTFDMIVFLSKTITTEK
jgi:CBS domain-containing protein